jgi:hypothetical protein
MGSYVSGGVSAHRPRLVAVLAELGGAEEHLIPPADGPRGVAVQVARYKVRKLESKTLLKPDFQLHRRKS